MLRLLLYIFFFTPVSFAWLRTIKKKIIINDNYIVFANGLLLYSAPVYLLVGLLLFFCGLLENVSLSNDSRRVCLSPLISLRVIYNKCGWSRI